MRTEIEALIAALEAGPPSRELDARVHLFMKPDEDWPLNFSSAKILDRGAGFAGLEIRHKWWISTARFIEAPSYTTSLDAALTLVPEGWWVTHAYWGGERPASFRLQNPEAGWVVSEASTPALALCIAALKARLAALEEGDD